MAGGAAPVNIPGLPTDIWVVQNMVYKTVAGVELKMDIYLPQDYVQPPPGTENNQYPVVINIHGGGFEAGDKTAISQQLDLAINLVRAKVVVVSIDYRLSTPTQATYPQAVQDCRDALRWVVKYGPGYRIDTNRIGLMGQSAGATLAALTGLAPDSMYKENPDVASTPIKVKCLVLWCGGYDFTNAAEANLNENLKQWIGGSPYNATYAPKYVEASAINYVTVNSPPMLMVHGTTDYVAPYEQSESLWRHIKYDIGGNVAEGSQMLQVYKGNHMFDPTIIQDQFPVFGNPTRLQIDEITLKFIKDHLNN